MYLLWSTRWTDQARRSHTGFAKTGGSFKLPAPANSNAVTGGWRKRANISTGAQRVGFGVIIIAGVHADATLRAYSNHERGSLAGAAQHGLALGLLVARQWHDEAALWLLVSELTIWFRCLEVEK